MKKNSSLLRRVGPIFAAIGLLAGCCSSPGPTTVASIPPTVLYTPLHPHFMTPLP